MAANINDYFLHVGDPGSATFLASPGHAIGGTTFTVDSTSLMPTDTAILFGVDTTSLVGGVATRDVGSYTVWRGLVTSATQITSCVLMYGTDQAYSAGSTTRVYVLPTTSRENRLVDGLLIDHSQSGAHEIATNYDPSNPTLETQKWVGVSSAVNELTVTNSITGAAPILSATGGDTNIGITLTPKGTGTVNLTNAALGTPASGVMTNVTGLPTTGLLNGAVTPAKLVADAGSTWAWSAWTPTWTNVTIGNATVTASYIKIGTTCFAKLKFIFNTTTSISGEIIFSLPLTALTATHRLVGNAYIEDAGVQNYDGRINLVSTTTAALRGVLTSGTYANQAVTSATVPFTWATNDFFECEFFYEVT